MVLEQGKVLNNIYRVLKLLGKGSMGHVYLVEKIEDDKKFVVKELFFQEQAGLDFSTAMEIFIREAEFMAKFHHQGLPKMHGIFEQNGRAYLTMDYIEGKTLEEILNSSLSPIPESQAIKWAMELASIFDYLHNSFHQPIVYRDLKPSNIIIKPDGKPVLVDFGIARYYNPDKNTDTFNYGTPGYAAPEQYKGRGRSTPQTDIFSLGVILFQMVTKYDPTLKPFTFPPMKTLNPSIFGSLEDIIKRAIQLEPLKRYISMQEFNEFLSKYFKTYFSYKTKELQKYPNKELQKYSNKELQKYPNKLAIIGKNLAFATVILLLVPLILFIISASNLTIILTFYAILICPVLGLYFSLEGSEKANSNPVISSVFVSDAIGYNTVLIIFLLLAGFIIAPGFLKARAQGRLAACDSNGKNMATSLEMYATDNYGSYPTTLDQLTRIGSGGGAYMKAIPVCPASHSPHSYGYTSATNPDNFTVWCQIPDAHADAGIKTSGYPQYSPGQGLSIGH